MDMERVASASWRDSIGDAVGDIHYEINRHLSQALKSLSSANRNNIREEVHGVRCLSVKETPELIQKSLSEFQTELDNCEEGKLGVTVYRFLNNHRDRHNHNYRNYAFQDNFRLRFLRCELFNVPKAAMRFCNYLCYTNEHWGNIALKRPIRMTDFVKSELKILRKGSLQILPYRDNSGRRVMIYLGRMEPHNDSYIQDKIFFYLMDAITQDSLESQQKGVVILQLSPPEIINSCKNTTSSRSNNHIQGIVPQLNRLKKLFPSIPSRIVAIHLESPNTHSHHLVTPLVTKVFGGGNAYLWPRFILAPMGSTLETKYWWKTYGIPIDIFPLTDTGSIKRSSHNQWMMTRRIVEKLPNDDHPNAVVTPQAIGETATTAVAIQSSNTGTTVGSTVVATSRTTGTLVECPGLNDVVFRKGSKIASIENPGNRLFRELIETFLIEKDREEGKQKLEQEESHHANCAKPSTPSQRLSPIEVTNVATTSSTAPSLGERKGTRKAFCEWLIDYIIDECDGRFLEWDTGSSSGWYVMRDKIQITHKVSITLYNWGKRFSALKIAASKRQEQNNWDRNPSLLSLPSSLSDDCSTRDSNDGILSSCLGIDDDNSAGSSRRRKKKKKNSSPRS